MTPDDLRELKYTRNMLELFMRDLPGVIVRRDKALATLNETTQELDSMINKIFGFQETIKRLTRKKK